MLSAVILSRHSYPAMLLAEQQVDQRSVHPGPLVTYIPLFLGVQTIPSSIPDIATLQCPWQDSRYTRGQFTPVLSSHIFPYF